MSDPISQQIDLLEQRIRAAESEHLGPATPDQGGRPRKDSTPPSSEPVQEADVRSKGSASSASSGQVLGTRRPLDSEDPRFRRVLRDTIAVVGGVGTYMSGTSALDDSELDNLTEGWAPLVAEHFGTLVEYSPWIAALSATALVVAPRLEEVAERKDSMESASELTDDPSPTF